MILIIDNHDSFVYNIVHAVAEYNSNITLIRKEDIKTIISDIHHYEKIIISPGPGHPLDSKENYILFDIDGCQEIPILGVCLGMQIIISAFGGKVENATNIMHGKTSKVIFNNKNKLFFGMDSPLVAMRYHSLIASRESLPGCFNITGYTKEKEIMSIQHNSRPIYGVQFHPESILTVFGKKIINNFINNV